MNDSLKISGFEFIIKNEFELDEIVKNYGRTGDEIEAHINQTKTNIIKIIRKYIMVENLGIEKVSEEVYNSNFQFDKSYYKIDHGDSIDYLKDNYDESEISKEDYDNEMKHQISGNQIFTSLNYSDFINDFDFRCFDNFFDKIVINQVSSEFLNDIEKFILSNNKTKGKILLQNCLSDLINSNKFLEAFKKSDEANYIQKEISGYFLCYNNIIKKNLLNYYELIFPELISYFSKNELIETENILKDLLYACYKTQKNKIYHDDTDENKRTQQILDLLSFKDNYKTETQFQTGMSSTGKKIGSCDGLIIDRKFNNEYYIEALNLSSFDKSYLKTHINKLEFNYDFKGLQVKFILVYCNLKENTFDDFVEKYKSYIENEMLYYYQKSIIKEEKVEYNKFANSRIFHSTHIREDRNVYLYHILLKFSEKP